MPISSAPAVPARSAPARLVAALVALAVVAGCAGVGGPKLDAPAHHRQHGFANTNPEYRRPGLGTRWRFLVSRAWTFVIRPRAVELTRVANNGRALTTDDRDATITWIGHATFLIQLDGVNVLTDPHWSERASPWSWIGPRRLTPPGLPFEALPPVHVVVISHDHYDSFDLPTVMRLAATHRPLFLVPLGLRAYLAERGVEQVEELDWWQQRTVRGVTLTCLPAQHWSARSLWDENRRLWSGWALAGGGRRLYFAGDSGYYEGFREIGVRLGRVDLAIIGIGAYEPPEMMQMSHTNPEEALRVFLDVGARRFVAMHWGTFDLAREPVDEPPVRLRHEADRLGLDPDRVWVLAHGETRRW